MSTESILAADEEYIRRQKASQPDKVNHPIHYGTADDPYEVIKVIDNWELGFCLGNTVKYIARAGRKLGELRLDDLKKARWYLQHEIEKLEGK